MFSLRGISNVATRKSEIKLIELNELNSPTILTGNQIGMQQKPKMRHVNHVHLNQHRNTAYMNTFC